MSGGHFDYSGFKLRDILEEIASDEEVKTRWPLLAAAFASLAPVLSDLDHDIDWDLSGDSSVGDDTEFDRKSIGKLVDVVLKAAPDDFFARGRKWITIQFIQRKAKRER